MKDFDLNAKQIFNKSVLLTDNSVNDNAENSNKNHLNSNITSKVTTKINNNKITYNPSMYLKSDENSDFEENNKNFMNSSRPISQPNIFDLNKLVSTAQQQINNNNINVAATASCPSSSGFKVIKNKPKTANSVIQQPKSAYNPINERLLSFDPFKNNISSSSSVRQSNNLFSKINVASYNKQKNKSRSKLNTPTSNTAFRPLSSVGFQQDNKTNTIITNNLNSMGLSKDLNDIFLRSQTEKKPDTGNDILSYLASSPPNSNQSLNFTNNILSQNDCELSIEMIKNRALFSPQPSSSLPPSRNGIKITSPKYYRSYTANTNTLTQSGLGHLLNAARVLNSSETKNSTEFSIPKIKNIANFNEQKKKRLQRSNLSRRGNVIFQEMDNLKMSFVDAARLGTKKKSLNNDLNRNYSNNEFLHTDCYRDLSYYHSDNDYTEHDKKIFAKRMSILNFRNDEEKNLVKFSTLAKMDMKKLSVESRFKRVNFTSGESKEISQLKGIMMMEEKSTSTSKTPSKFDLQKIVKPEKSKEAFPIKLFSLKKNNKRKLDENKSKPNSKKIKTDINSSGCNINDASVKFNTTGKNIGKQLMPFQKLSFKAPSTKVIKPKLVKSQSIKRRSKQGCWTCRLRKKKCSEERDKCINCVKLGIPCDYSVEKPIYMSNTEAKQAKQLELKTISTTYKACLSTKQKTLINATP